MKARKLKIKPDRMKIFKKIMHLLWKLGELNCSYCGVKFALENKMTAPQLDHIIPATRNGSNHISNLAPCCGKCNNTKAQNIWVVRYPNFGFGTVGVKKKEFKIDGNNYDEIISTLQLRVDYLQKVPKDTPYMYFWLNDAMKHQTVKNFNVPYFKNDPRIISFVNGEGKLSVDIETRSLQTTDQGQVLMVQSTNPQNLVAIPEKLGILGKLKAFWNNLTKGRVNV